MAGVERNREVWQSEWDWATEGDEWSVWWGGTPALWHGALLPRVHAYVPAGHILEIAPGYGRWTQYLKDLADQLTVVDLTERCIEGCKSRFASSTNIDYHVNDGKSLAMVEDGSVDFVFSFDSLVHAEEDVLEAYLQQLATKLKPDGVGFFHHSNAGAYSKFAAVSDRVPDPVRRKLVPRGLLFDIYAWRARTVTAEGFVQACDRAGLVCFAQEKVSWEAGYFLQDAISVFARAGSRWDRPLSTVSNRLFRAEARRMSQLYSGSRLQG